MYWQLSLWHKIASKVFNHLCSTCWKLSEIKLLKIEKILYKLIKTKQYNKYWEFLEKYFNIKGFSEKFKNLFLKLVAYNPDERLSIDEIKNDEWMQDVTNATPEYLNFLRNKMINEMNL